MRIEQDQDHETKRDRVRRLLLGPLEEMPGLASWFGSAAGRAALAEGRLREDLYYRLNSGQLNLAAVHP